MGVQSIVEAKKPCLISWGLLDEIVINNLSFLAKSPFDVIAPNKFDIGLKNLCEYCNIKITKQPDYTYLIEAL